jgi:hypothetical protein
MNRSCVLISSTGNPELTIKLRKIAGHDGKDWRGGHVTEPPPAPYAVGINVYTSNVLTGAEHFDAVLTELGLEIVQDDAE